MQTNTPNAKLNHCLSQPPSAGYMLCRQPNTKPDLAPPQLN